MKSDGVGPRTRVRGDDYSIVRESTLGYNQIFGHTIACEVQRLRIWQDGDPKDTDAQDETNHVWRSAEDREPNLRSGLRLQGNCFSLGRE